MLALPADIDRPALIRALSSLGASFRRALRRELEAHALQVGEVPSHSKEVHAGRHDWAISQDEQGFWHKLVPARGRPIEATDADLDYLAAADELGLSPVWDALLNLAAQQLLRRFARRLPGFGLSQFDYLYSNFLAVSARADRGGDRYVVQLSRPPLALMLSLAGMTRTEYALPWRPGCRCALYAEES